MHASIHPIQGVIYPTCFMLRTQRVNEVLKSSKSGREGGNRHNDSTIVWVGWSRKIPKSVKCLLQKHENLSSVPRGHVRMLGVSTHL